MELKELRLSKGLTQAEVSNLAGISLRSYKEYENNHDKIQTIKYKYLLQLLEQYGYIDEEHGILDVNFIKNTVSQILEKHNVNYCYLFGSYAKNKATEKSDVDLLISTNISGMAFYGLAEELREALNKKVDLLNVDQLINNVDLLNDILKDGIKIYRKK